MKSIYKIILLTVLFFVIGFTAGYFLNFYNERPILAKLDRSHPVRLDSASYKFINPLLSYAVPSADQDSRFSALKNKISSLINSGRYPKIQTLFLRV